MSSYSVVTSVRNSVQLLTEMLRHCPCSRRKCSPLGSLKFKRFDFLYTTVLDTVSPLKSGVSQRESRILENGQS